MTDLLISLGELVWALVVLAFVIVLGIVAFISLMLNLIIKESILAICAVIGIVAIVVKSSMIPVAKVAMEKVYSALRTTSN